MKRRIITVGNHKGGVGKTTTAITLSHGLALGGRSVLIVDADPQGQVATFLALHQEPCLFELLVNRRPLSDAVRSAAIDGHERERLFVVPGNRYTTVIQTVLNVDNAPASQALERVLGKADYDYVIFDTSPSIGILQEAVLAVSDWLIAPCAVDYAATEGLGEIVSTLRAVNAKGGRCEILAVVPTMYDTVTNASRDTLGLLRQHFGTAVAKPIHRATVLRECAAEGLTIWEKDPDCQAGKDYADLVRLVQDAG